MSGGNITTAKIETNHDGKYNWDTKQCVLYLTGYVFDFGVANSETEVNRGFPLCFQEKLNWHTRQAISSSSCTLSR